MSIIARLVLAASLTPLLVWGQAISTAQIKGTVQDGTGASVAEAEVRVTQTDTGATRIVNTGSDGAYLLTSLPIGPYRMEVSKAGFSKYVQSGIVLQVASNPTIEVSLQVGSVNEQVQVEANAAMVETQTTGVGQVIDQQRVVDLPLNGRTVTDLILLTGGAVTGRTSRSSYPSSAAVSIAGGGQGSVSYVLDGGTHNDPLSNQNLPLPFPDALQEFKVETSSLPAQYGMHSAGAVNVVTKAGGNQIHGNLFEFVRNYKFNARNSFQPVRDSLKRNQFGGTIGGAIVKDKLFYFLGYQNTIVKSSPAATVAFVPTPAMLAGDFTAVTSAACRPGLPALTLAAASGFTNNQISPTRFDPISLNLQKLLPTTADPCGRITYALPASFDESQGVAKVDYQMTEKHSMFGRYFISHYESPTGDPAGNLLVRSRGGASNNVFTATFGDTYLLRSNMVSSFRITANRSSNTTVYNQYVNLADLGVTGLAQLPVEKFGKYLGGWTTTNGFGIATTPSFQPYLTWHVSEDVSLTHGAHQITFGMNFANLKATAINYLNSNGSYTFQGNFSGLQNADFLLGTPTSFTQAAPSYSVQRQNIFSLYVQDAWKVTKHLTVNAGVRWDPFFGHTNPYNQTLSVSLDNFYNNKISKVLPNAPAGFIFGGDEGLPVGKYSPDKKKTFSPRLGIVWDPKGDGRMSIRAGYGIFYDFPNFAFDQFGFAQPFGGSFTINPTLDGTPNTRAVINTPWAGVASGNPFPLVSPDKYTYNSNNAALVFGYPLDVKPTYIQQYNLSIQRQFGGNWLLSANYVGNSTRHLWANNPVNQSQFLGTGACTINGVSIANCGTTATTAQRRRLNFLNPSQGKFFGDTYILDEGGTANYNGLILSATHRFGNNFTSTTNFTWSHCISDNYTTALGLGATSQTRFDNRRADRGNCVGADVRKVFNQTLVVTPPSLGSGFLKKATRDWKIAASAIAQTGQQLTVTAGVDRALTGNAGVQRVNQVLDDVYLPNKGQSGWLNPAAFAQPAIGTFGNMGPTNVRGPGAFTLNTSLARAFKFRERHTIEIRGEAFNLLNYVNFYNPVTSLSATNFGQIVPTAGGFGSAPTDPRIMQFALKYTF
jgi:Carboxypeptidase regulatory-like domain/TonB dependent receptor